MVTAGALNDLVRSLQVSVAVGGQLIAVAALVMALGAPLLAFAVSGWDRRRLLVFALVWYGSFFSKARCFRCLVRPQVWRWPDSSLTT